MEEAGIVVIGAGVAGLAVAAELSRTRDNIVVLEQHASFGQETSSRNSEVIHVGMYYPPGSLKARLCVEGNRLLYALCREAGIPHRRLGKLIVATDEREVEILEGLRQRGRENGVEDLDFLPRSELAAYGSLLQAREALLSPSTGIIDSHSLMKHLEFAASRQDTLFCYGTRVLGIARRGDGYVLDIQDADGERITLMSPLLVNCAGLAADQVAAMVGLDPEKDGCALYFRKGEYFKVNNRRSVPTDRLIYPVPEEATLGAHTVVDLQGDVKIGPKTFAVERRIDYRIDETHQREFYEACKPFLPQLAYEDLTPDMAGLSPTRCGTDSDFYIRNEEAKGLPGFINLVGMNSPALTSCLAIARHVSTLLD